MKRALTFNKHHAFRAVTLIISISLSTSLGEIVTLMHLHALSILSSVCFACVVTSCKQDSKSQLVQRNTHINTSPTEDEVRKVVMPGTSRRTILEAFGLPSAEDRAPDGTIVDTYMVPLEPVVSWKDKFSGFEVYYKDDHVTKWLPSHSELTVPNGRLATNQSSSPNVSGAPSELSFYVVSEAPLTNGIYVDTIGLPKLGYIGPHPDLIVGRLERVNKEQQPSPSDQGTTNYSLAIMFSTNDTEALSRISRGNLGAQLLTVVNGKPLMAARLLSPIDTGQLRISHLSEKQADDLKSILVALTGR